MSDNRTASDLPRNQRGDGFWGGSQEIQGWLPPRGRYYGGGLRNHSIRFQRQDGVDVTEDVLRSSIQNVERPPLPLAVQQFLEEVRSKAAQK